MPKVGNARMTIRGYFCIWILVGLFAVFPLHSHAQTTFVKTVEDTFGSLFASTHSAGTFLDTLLCNLFELFCDAEDEPAIIAADSDPHDTPTTPVLQSGTTTVIREYVTASPTYTTHTYPITYVTSPIAEKGYVTETQFANQVDAIYRSMENNDDDDDDSSSSFDLSAESIETLSDVAAMAESAGDLLSWNGSAWTNVSTSTLGIVGGLAASDLDTSAELRAILTDETGTGTLVFNTNPVFSGSITTALANGCVEVSSGVLTSTGSNCGTGGGGITSLNSLTGSSQTFATSTSGGLSLHITSSGSTHTFTAAPASGYAIPLAASTTNWNDFFDTPSSRVAAGDALTWSSNTLNFDGGTVPGGQLGGTWANPTIDDLFILNSGDTLSGDFSITGSLMLGGAFLDAANASGTLGMLLQSTGTSTRWVATSTIGISGSSFDQDLNTTDTVSFETVSVTGTATSSFAGSISIAGSIIPTADITYDLGSPTRQWRDVYIGPGSLYINGKKVIEDVSDTITFSTDADQNLVMETTASGNVTVRATSTGNANLTTASGNISLLSAAGNINIGTSGSGQLNLGTIDSGVWNGTAIGSVYGGTGLTSYLTGDMLYASGANTIAKRSIGNSGDVLSVVGGVPTWVATSTLGITTSGSGTATSGPAFSVNKGGTNQTVTADTFTLLTWNTEIFDTNSNFASNRFTPTVAGKYLVTFNMLCANSTSRCQSAIYKNGTRIADNINNDNESNNTAAISFIVDMNGTTDYLEAYGSNGGGTTIDGDTRSTNFTGALIAPLYASGGGWSNDGTQSYMTDFADLVGIGTSTPAAKLHIQGSAGSTDILKVSSSTGSSLLTISSAGNLGLAASSYLNWGTTLGTSGYGLRDNGGTIEFKNSGGSWTSIGTGSSGTATSGPAFSVNKGGTAQTVTAGVSTLVTWSTEVFDTNNNFDLSTERFTPTVAGKYLFVATVGCNNGTTCIADIFKNGSIVARGFTRDTIGSAPISMVIDMNGTTDYVELFTTNADGTTIAGGPASTNFSGALIAPLYASGGGWSNDGTQSYITDLADLVGIGTSTPAAKLHIQGSAGSTDILKVSSSTGSSLFTISSAGNLGLAASSYLNWGTTLGTSGYGLRDNGGTIEFKNSGGSWTSIGTGSSGTATSGPAFSVNRNGSSQTVSTDTDTLIDWSTEDFDTNSNFNLSTDRFTPTVTGKYIITLAVRCSGATSACSARLYKNGALFKFSEAAPGGAANQTAVVTAVVDMNGTTDYLEAYGRNEGSTTILGQSYATYFTGALVAPLYASNSGWSLSGTEVYATDFADNVAIGTSTPSAKLHVIGTAGTSTDIFSVASSTGSSLLTVTAAGKVGVGTSSPFSIFTIQSNDNAEIGISNSGTNGRFWRLGDGSGSGVAAGSFSIADQTAGGASRFLINSSGNVGIGTTTPSAKLYVIGTAGTSTDIFSVASSTGTKHFTVTASGNVGIGTTTPTDILHVWSSSSSGTSLSLENTNSSGRHWRIQSDNDGTLKFRDQTALAHRLVINSSGNVGIGTTTPGATLDVQGSIETGGGMNHFTGWGTDSAGWDTRPGDGNTKKYVFNNHYGLTFSAHSAYDGIRFYNQGTNSGTYPYLSDATLVMAVNDGGVGILMGSPSVALDVSGSIEYTGTITDVSDERLKENIHTLEGNLSKILTLTPVSFTMKDDASSTPQLGFIAQNVLQAYSEPVSYIDPDQSDYLGLDYTQLIAPAIGSIIELHGELEDLFTYGTTTASSTLAALFEEDTVWSRLVTLAQNFVDGVLTITGIKVEQVQSERIEGGEVSAGTLHIDGDVCVDDICIGKEQFKALIQDVGAHARDGAGTEDNEKDDAEDGETDDEILPQGEDREDQVAGEEPQLQEGNGAASAGEEGEQGEQQELEEHEDGEASAGVEGEGSEDESAASEAPHEPVDTPSENTPPATPAV